MYVKELPNRFPLPAETTICRYLVRLVKLLETKTGVLRLKKIALNGPFLQ